MSCSPLRRRSLLTLLAALLLAGGLARPAGSVQPPVTAIATFSILGDMVREVGGERVEVRTLVGPDGDAHVFQPTPADARAVATATIIFANGLGFDNWIKRLAKSAGFKGPLVIASEGITPLPAGATAGHKPHGHRHHGHHHDVDPHAWQDLANGARYVRTIAEALSRVDPPGAATYRANAERYLAEIAALDAEVRAALGALPAERRRVVTGHDAFAYFAAAYGITVLAPQGVSTDAEASAQDVARLIDQIRADRIAAVFLENIADPRLMEQIRRETGAAVGGTLFSDALSPPHGPAPTYLDMFRHNVRVLTQALAS